MTVWLNWRIRTSYRPSLIMRLASDFDRRDEAVVMVKERTKIMKILKIKAKT
jgi:hypothetical protein